VFSYLFTPALPPPRWPPTSQASVAHQLSCLRHQPVAMSNEFMMSDELSLKSIPSAPALGHTPCLGRLRASEGDSKKIS